MAESKAIAGEAIEGPCTTGIQEAEVQPQDSSLQPGAAEDKEFQYPQEGYSMSAPPEETFATEDRGGLGLDIHVDEAVLSGKKPRARTIMIAVDESDHTSYTLLYTLAIIATREDTIILLNAYPDVEQYLMNYEPPAWVKDAQEKYKRTSEEVLDKISSAFKKLKIKFKTRSTRGDPRDALQNAVKIHQPDLLIIGSRGHGMVKRALLGSVSDYAAHHVDCPVLIVKMPSSKQASGIDDLVSGMEKLGHSTAPAA